MASEVTLPALGESVTEGTVTRWLKQVGDTVAVDEPLLEVSTDKVDTEIPSPVAGTLLEIKAQEDDTVEVGAVLGVIGDEGESGGDADDTAEPEAQPKDEQEAEKKAEQEEEIVEEKGELPAGDETPEAEKSDSPAAEEPAAEKSSGGSGGGSGGGDSTSVTLPALGESVTEGTVTRWLKQVGDDVAVDEPLLEVSTDKVDTEIPSPVAGTLLEIKVEEDETVEVGAELATIGSGDAAASSSGSEEKDEPAPAEDKAEEKAEEPAPAAEEKAEEPAAEEKSEPAAKQPAQEQPAAQEKPKQEEAPQQEAPAAAPSRSDDQSAYVTPLVRKMASQHGVDLSAVSGTGVGGRIRKQDVLDAAAAAQQQAQRRSRPSSRPPRPRLRPPLPPPPVGPLRPAPRRPCAAPPRRSRACARSSPSGWSTRCRRRPS